MSSQNHTLAKCSREKLRLLSRLRSWPLNLLWVTCLACDLYRTPFAHFSVHIHCILKGDRRKVWRMLVMWPSRCVAKDSASRLHRSYFWICYVHLIMYIYIFFSWTQLNLNLWQTSRKRWINWSKRSFVESEELPPPDQLQRWSERMYDTEWESSR